MLPQSDMREDENSFDVFVRLKPSAIYFVEKMISGENKKVWYLRLDKF